MHPTLTPEEIRNARFTTGFRGYDTGEVRTFLGRVASAYGAAIAGLEGADERLTILAPPAVPEVAEHPEVSDAVVEADVELADEVPAPEQVAEVRSSIEAESEARTQISEMLAAARNEAHAIVAKANDEAARIILRARAESRGKPSGEGAALVEAAFTETPSDPTLAKEQARLMISEARAVRERILTDLAKRRKSAHIQLEQLRVAREKLLESLRDVRRVVDDATRDLSTAEVEARLAAETAGRRVASEPEPTAADLDAELTGAGHLTRLFGDVGSRSSAMGEATDDTDEPEAGDAAVARTIDLTAGGPAADDPSSTTPSPVWTGAFAPAGQPSPGDASVTASEDEPRVMADVDELFAKLRAERERERARPAPVRDVPGGDDVTASRTDGRPARPKRAKAPTKKPSAVPEQHVEGRAGVAVLDAEHILDLGALADEAATRGSEIATETIGETSADRDPLDERMLFVTGPLQSQLVRAVKRHLQDEQSTALAVLRTARGRVTLDAVIGDGPTHLDRLGGSMVAMFTDAYRAGLGEMGSHADDADAHTMVQVYADEVAREVSDVVRSDLGHAIDAAASPESDRTSLAESISACYRSWTTDRINALSAEMLVAAFRLGRSG